MSHVADFHKYLQAAEQGASTAAFDARPMIYATIAQALATMEVAAQLVELQKRLK